jgi:hypothetical protein
MDLRTSLGVDRRMLNVTGTDSTWLGCCSSSPIKPQSRCARTQTTKQTLLTVSSDCQTIGEGCDPRHGEPSPSGSRRRLSNRSRYRRVNPLKNAPDSSRRTSTEMLAKGRAGRGLIRARSASKIVNSTRTGAKSLPRLRIFWTDLATLSSSPSRWNDNSGTRGGSTEA